MALAIGFPTCTDSRAPPDFEPAAPHPRPPVTPASLPGRPHGGLPLQPHADADLNRGEDQLSVQRRGRPVSAAAGPRARAAAGRTFAKEGGHARRARSQGWPSEGAQRISIALHPCPRCDTEDLARARPISTKLGPEFVPRIWPGIRPTHWPNTDQLGGPKLAKFDRSIDLETLQVARTWSNLSEYDQRWPGHMAQIDQHWPGHVGGELGQLWPGYDQSWPDIGPVRPNLARTQPKFRPNSANHGPSYAAEGLREAAARDSWGAMIALLFAQGPARNCQFSRGSSSPGADSGAQTIFTFGCECWVCLPNWQPSAQSLPLLVLVTTLAFGLAHGGSQQSATARSRAGQAGRPPPLAVFSDSDFRPSIDVLQSWPPRSMVHVPNSFRSALS